MTKCLNIPLDKIEVPSDRARDFDPAWAEGLARIIQAQGLLHPIRVRVVDNSYRLVAGLVRLEAHRILGEPMIAAFISPAATDDAARLEEVMENLGRAELIALDRCHHLFELKQVWERMYPHTKAGVAGAMAKHGAANEIFSFAREIATKIGLSQRSIQIAVKIWSDLTPDSRQRLRGTPWAAKQAEISLLAGENPKRQADILDKLLMQNARVSSVADAIGLLNNGVVFDDVERKFVAANKVFGKLADPVLDRLIVANEERIVASLKRQGRI